jgi:hypothetical protein
VSHFTRALKGTAGELNDLAEHGVGNGDPGDQQAKFSSERQIADEPPDDQQDDEAAG